LLPVTIEGYRYYIGKFISFCLELNLTDPAEVEVDDVRLFMLKLKETNSPQLALSLFMITIDSLNAFLTG